MFFGSQALEEFLHALSQAQVQDQATKQGQAASWGPGSPICGQPDSPLTFPIVRCGRAHMYSGRSLCLMPESVSYAQCAMISGRPINRD